MYLYSSSFLDEIYDFFSLTDHSIADIFLTNCLVQLITSTVSDILFMYGMKRPFVPVDIKKLDLNSITYREIYIYIF